MNGTDLGYTLAELHGDQPDRAEAEALLNRLRAQRVDELFAECVSHHLAAVRERRAPAQA